MQKDRFSDDHARTPKLAFGILAAPRRVIAQLTEPSNRTQHAMWLVAILTGLMLWAYHGSLAAGLLGAALIAGPLTLARRWRIKRMTADLHACLVKLIKSAEHEADVAQDRRLMWRVLRTGNWSALWTWTMREDARTRVRPGKYVHLTILGGGVWPTRAHITAATIRWAPPVEISQDKFKTRLTGQVATWWGGEVQVEGGWDGPRRRVTLIPKADSNLPTSVAYPGPLTGEDHREDREVTRGDRETGGRSGGIYDPGKPRWSNSPYSDDEGPR